MGLAGLLTSIARHRRGAVDRPRFLTHTVTFACNARCAMCDSWRLDSRGDLELAEIDAIYAQLPRLDGVRLTGGEPFVRRDLGDILELAERRLRPRYLQITTNGFLTERIVELAELRARRRPLHLLVSLDAVGADHDALRGVPRAWERALTTLEALAPRRAELALRLGVNQTVIDAEGLHHARRLRARLAPLGLVPQLVLAYDESATYSVERDRVVTQAAGLPAGLDAAAFERLVGEADAALAGAPRALRWAKRFYVENLRRRAAGLPSATRCVALGSHLRLFPDGSVPTCQFNSRTAGSLRTQSFAELWRSERAATQRRWVAACEGCTAECELLPSALYTGAWLGRLLPARARAPRLDAVGSRAP